MMGLDRLAGARVVVAGAGIAGAAAVRALLDLGARTTVTDSSLTRLEALLDSGVGSGRVDSDLAVCHALEAPPPGTDLVITSPGFRPDAPLVTAAAAAGIEVVGEVELAWWLGEANPGGPPEWLVVTGTNGKTTTVGMLAAILDASGASATACGNIGLSAVDAARAGYRVLAVELSSFQLYWSFSLRPRAATVLNLAEDHLDWHGDMAAYAAAKGKVNDAATVVYNADDEASTRLAAHRPDAVGTTLAVPGPGQLGVVDGWLVDRAFTSNAAEKAALLAAAEVRPAGPHNVANALAAAALARAYGVSPEAVAAGLAAFRPGGHRAVEVGTVAGVRYINDSKATNPHAAIASLQAHSRVVWIAGGLLKGASVEELVREVAPRLAGVVLIGADRDEFSAALARHAPQVPVRVVATRDDSAMADVVAEAAVLARQAGTGGTLGTGDTLDAVVLAPAAASMDMFTDYGHRGRAFADAVTASAARGAPAGE